MTENVRRGATDGTSPALCHAAGDAPAPSVPPARSGERHGARRGGGTRGPAPVHETDADVPRPSSRRIGDGFEARARRFLECRRLVFVAANVTVRGGELDLVMREPDGTLVFVEVRARSRRRYGGAAASIGWHKQRRILHAARAVWARHGGQRPCRFDVIAFEAGRLVWLRDAFRDEGDDGPGAGSG